MRVGGVWSVEVTVGSQFDALAASAGLGEIFRRWYSSPARDMSHGRGDHDAAFSCFGCSDVMTVSVSIDTWMCGPNLVDLGYSSADSRVSSQTSRQWHFIIDF